MSETNHDASAEDLPVIDRARLNEVTDGDAEFEVELLAQYQLDMEKNLRTLGEMASAGGDVLVRTAHNIKGTSANVGVLRVSVAAAALETAARDGKSEEWRKHHAEVMREYDLFCETWAKMKSGA